MHVHVPNRASWFVSIWACAILAFATLVLCQVAEGNRFPASSPALSDALTIPITMERPADLRQYSLPVGLAVLLIFFALNSPQSSTRDDGIKQVGGRVSADLFVFWFAACGAGVAALAIGSELYNSSWGLSKGWIFHLAVGLGWAVLVGRLASIEIVERILIGGFVVALVAIGLSFRHRHLSGLRDVQWPIGPITITAALGALWVALAVGRLGARLSPPSSKAQVSRVTIGLTVLAGVSSLLLLQNAARRAGWLGLATAVAFVILAVGWKRFSNRTVRIGMIATVSAAAALGGWWLVTQATSPVREVGGSIALRAAIWQRTIELTSESWLIGRGPDMFVCEMTTAMARAKAETPHLLHGEIAAAAHNEWLQAGFELGVIGGLAYLALPFIAIAGALATFFNRPDDARGLHAIPVCAGLVAVVVVESVSINLRNPVMPAWYWTLMGLALACSRGPAGRGFRLPDWAPRPSVLRFVGCGLAIVILLVVFDDVQSGTALARAKQLRGADPTRAAGVLEFAVDRLGARQCLEARIDLARAQSDVVRGIAGAGPGAAGLRQSDLGREHARWSRSAVETWEELSICSPGYPGVGVGLAEALMDAGRLVDARETLARILRDVNPYEARANLLYVRFLEDDTEGRLDCVRRAARSGPIIEAMLDIVDACLSDSNTAAAWSAEVTEARASASVGSDGADPLAPEVLRIEAARLNRHGDAAGAARLQAIAVRAYQRMYESNDPHRRSADAEWDAWYRAAAYTLRADPSEYMTAYEQVCEAERFAVLGVDHAYLRESNSAAEFVGGEVIPLELPARLRPLWRLSAKLHLAAGRDEHVDLRILSSLPMERWGDGPAGVRAELEAELVADFATIAPKRRPMRFRGRPPKSAGE